MEKEHQHAVDRPVGKHEKRSVDCEGEQEADDVGVAGRAVMQRGEHEHREVEIIRREHLAQRNLAQALAHATDQSSGRVAFGSVPNHEPAANCGGRPVE